MKTELNLEQNNVLFLQEETFHGFNFTSHYLNKSIFKKNLRENTYFYHLISLIFIEQVFSKNFTYYYKTKASYLEALIFFYTVDL